MPDLAIGNINEITPPVGQNLLFVIEIVLFSTELTLLNNYFLQ